MPARLQSTAPFARSSYRTPLSETSAANLEDQGHQKEFGKNGSDSRPSAR